MKFVTLIGAAASACMITAAAQAQDWRGWNIHPEGYPNSVALDQFIEEVNANTDLTLQVFHGGVLGSQPDAIEQVRSGALEFGQSRSAWRRSTRSSWPPIPTPPR